MVHEPPSSPRVPVDRRMHQNRLPPSLAPVDTSVCETSAWGGTMKENGSDEVKGRFQILLA